MAGEMIFLRPTDIQITSANKYQLIFIEENSISSLHCARYKWLFITWKENVTC